MSGGLDPYFRQWFVALTGALDQYGIPYRVTSTFRSTSEQARLYQRWRDGRSPYPAAPPGRSAHNYGLAFDLVVRNPYTGDYSARNNPYQEWLGRGWEAWGGRWGGLSDPVHFEAPWARQVLAEAG